MGTIGDRNQKFQHTEQTVLEILNASFLSKPVYCVNNLFLFKWESDYAAKTKAGYWYEIEVKVSLEDFKRDFVAKTDKHDILSGRVLSPLKPNYFLYAVPANIVHLIRPFIPFYAGLISVPNLEHVRYVETVKQAPAITKEKLSDEQLDLTRKFYFNYNAYKQKYLGFEEERRRLKGEADFWKAEFEAASGMKAKDYLKNLR